MTLQVMNMSDTTFDNCLDRLISFGDDLVNLNMRRFSLRNLNNSTTAIELDTTTAIISELLAVNNVSTSGALINFRDSNVTITNSVFDNNSGDGNICITGNISGQFNLTDSQFINNSALGPFPKPVMGLSNIETDITNCLFENSFAQGSQPDVIGQFRGDATGPTVRFDNCRFINNTSLGSIPNIMEIGYGAYGIVSNCVFDGNTTDAAFLGITSVNPLGFEITNNTFINHTVDEPFVNMYNTNNLGDVVLTGNRFDNNTYTELNIGRFESITFNDNQFYGDNIELTLDRTNNVSFTNDYSIGNSGGIEFISFREVSVDMENVILISTAFSGTHTLIESRNDTSLNITNSTFVTAGPTNAEVEFDDILPSTLRNSIIWSRSGVVTQSGLTGATGNLTIDHSLVIGENPTGTGNIDGTNGANAPAFVSPTTFDFRMQRCSPTINAGLNSYTSLTNDLQGNPRIFETTIDLGAYEIQEPFNVTCTAPPVPPCTTLISPLDGDTDVDVTTAISWNPVAEAIGYILQIGSTPGANDIVDVTLGNTTTYHLSNALSYDSRIYITIIPYNGSGNAANCNNESFFTLARPSCTNLTFPVNGAVDVIVGSNIT